MHENDRIRFISSWIDDQRHIEAVSFLENSRQSFSSDDDRICNVKWNNV